VLLLATAAAGAPRVVVDGACPEPGAHSRLDAPLPHAAAKLRQGGELVVVAVGSSSTAGVGASSPANGYPGELQAELAARLPRAAIRVLNKGVSGETWRTMIARFDRDVLAFHPDLVVWQLGTNAVVREDGVAQDEAAIRAGVEQLEAAGADVILMNPQYAPAVLRDPDCPEMLRLLDDVGARAHAPVFHRFAVMREWVTSGRAALASIVASDGLHMNDLGHRCIGKLLADAIAADVSPGPAAK